MRLRLQHNKLFLKIGSFNRIWTIRQVILFVLTVGLGLVLISSYKAQGETPKSLQRYAASLGFKRPIEPYKAIYWAAKYHKVDARKLVRIAIIESGIDHKAYRVNKNGTEDKGMFQLNTVAIERYCPKVRAMNLYDNAQCAAKILASIKKNKSREDPYWVGRYHSSTPSRKVNYVQKLKELEYRGKR